MTVLFVSIPIIIIILLITVVVVFGTDSKKYLQKLDNAKQAELEKLRADTIEKIKKKKFYNSKKEQLNEENIVQQRELIEMIKKQNQQINELEQYKKILQNKNNNKTQLLTQTQELKNNESIPLKNEKLVFNKTNLVRGMIANEYLNKKINTRRYR